jgi:predicted dehydrogenase
MTRRAVVIGAGRRGSAWVAAVAADPAWDLAGVVDLDTDAAARAAGSNGVRHGSDLAAMLAATGADAAVIATPAHDHVAPCITALDHRCAVLVEKPLATSLCEAVELVEHAERVGRPLIVGQNYRYLRWVRAARRVVESGALGTVRMASMRYDRPWADLDPAVAAIPNSVLWEMAPHHFDLVRHVLGDEVQSIRAAVESLDPARPAGATVHAVVGTERGARVSYAASYEARGVRRIEGGRRFTMRIVGDRATLHVFQRWLLLQPDGRPARPVRRMRRTTTEEASLLADLRAALDGREPPTSGRDNLRTVACLEACLISSASGRDVDPRKLLSDAGR